MATITTAELAADLDTTPRTLRKFLRDDAKGVGKGSRYAIEKREVRSLTKRFNTWLEAKANDAEAPADNASDAPDTPTDD